MHKIDKFLKSLDEKERIVAERLLKILKLGKFENLDIKKLKGYHGFFRVRKGEIRIVYRIDENEKIELVFIGRKTDNTYKGL
ncbi:type II toxin-antitoxin system RelE/ParE family toxin [Patescibacteria group bacterium]|nr:type II toxin-antitoxin system RelE/ParE family toxin [Patescibacteria group bacterium]